MNRHLPWLIAIVLLVTAGCPPRHPPHTPQPFGMKNAEGSWRNPDVVWRDGHAELSGLTSFPVSARGGSPSPNSEDLALRDHQKPRGHFLNLDRAAHAS